MRALLILLPMMFLFWQCSNEQAAKKDHSSQVEEIVPRGDTTIPEGYVKMEKERDLATERALAASKLERYMAADPEPMQLIAGRTFEVDYRMVVSKAREDGKVHGERIRFNQDFTYEWYREDKLSEKGKYFYGLKSDRVLFLSDDESQFPSEWLLKNSGEIMVLVGTSTFENNNTQLHLVLRSDD